MSTVGLRGSREAALVAGLVTVFVLGTLRAQQRRVPPQVPLDAPGYLADGQLGGIARTAPLVVGGARHPGRLVISPATARTHVSRAMTKLHARDGAQLVVIAYRSGLVHSPLT